MGPLQEIIELKIRAAFAPVHLWIENESHSHGHKGRKPQAGAHKPGALAETHFKVLIVSEHFAGQTRVARQRKVYDLFTEEMNKLGLHALALRTLTPTEWNGEKETTEFQSPPCMTNLVSKAKAAK